jgi:hypothetical protein
MKRGWFGPRKADVWQQLSREIGGTYVESRFLKGDKVVARAKDWTVTLDIYVVSTGHAHHSYTRFRAPYVNRDGFRFTVYRKSIFSGLGKLFGMQDVDIGVPEFDDDFVVKGTDESRLRTLFASPRLREGLAGQPSIKVDVKDDDGWFGRDFPEGVDELVMIVNGVVKDIDRLKALFELFATTLDSLCAMGSAYERGPVMES